MRVLKKKPIIICQFLRFSEQFCEESFEILIRFFYKIYVGCTTSIKFFRKSFELTKIKTGGIKN